MKVLNSVPLGRKPLIHYLHDESTLRLVYSAPHLEVLTLDLESLASINRLVVQTEPHDFYSACIDNDCIYVPTKLGQILAIDKFSSEILATINLGMPIMSDVLQDDKQIYVICGVPLSRERNLVVDNYCLCICSKETGKKEVQTSYFDGNLALITKEQGCIWVIGGRSLLKFSLDGELLHKTMLGSYLDYAPLVDDEFVICVSKNGMTRVLRKDNLSIHLTRQFPSCIGEPRLISGFVVWLTPQGLCYLNHREQVFHEIAMNIRLLAETTVSSDETKLFACDPSGSIVSVDLNTTKARQIKLAETILRKPLVADNFLFVVSDDQLHHLQVEP